MAAFDDVVIISGCRTPVGKFQGSLSDLTAPQLGAVVVREAVKRANLDPKQVDECIMGNVISAGLGTESRAPGRYLRWPRSRSRCHDYKQSVRLWTQSSRARRPGYSDREQFDCGCRRHGIHDQCALPAAPGA